MSSFSLFYVTLFGVICLVLCDVDHTIQKGADTAKAGAHETESVFGPAAKGLEASAHNIGDKFKSGLDNIKSGINEKVESTIQNGADSAKAAASGAKESAHDAVQGAKNAASNVGDKVQLGVNKVNEKTADARGAISEKMREGAHNIEPDHV